MRKPTAVTLHKKSRILEIGFDDERTFELPCEYLRVFSPSAEVQGHGPGQEKLQVGKKYVNITDIKPMGNYAIQLVFDDKHDSGIFSWDLLHELGLNQKSNWTDYLARLDEAGASREPAQSGK
ncbi:MAG: gamma-butyrobetaine hydroxylase-like domain-containing protein [bacterium]